ncbi:unnamed protein product [Rotaria sordida]|uniref:Uncharacterized protein n=1 Tax=Rotaria sordida TaxID=392033 RepID=A0A819BFZ2_9BILA|nr:unnamed protein product [Rotaria sordida]CAF3801422.1 unnamed protein product [Rotaria sordida]
MSKLSKKIGIAMLGPPLAAGKLECPLVGKSEAIILDLCMRGNRLSHLMCCVSIDEIASLAWRRDEDSSDLLTLFISISKGVAAVVSEFVSFFFEKNSPYYFRQFSI